MTDSTHAPETQANPHILTVLVEAYAASDHGDGPQFARFQVNEEFAGRLAEMQVLLKDYDLSEARIYAAPDKWGPGDIEDELRLVNAELVVAGQECWFIDQPKHAGYHIETRGMSITTILNAFNAGDPELILGENPFELRDRANEDDATEDEEAPSA